MADFLPLNLIGTLEKRAADILPKWGLPRITPVLIRYRENAIFRVARLDGGLAGLRLHRPGYQDEQALRSEMLWMQMLHKAGLAVPEPIPTADGDLIVRLEEEDGSVQHADLLNWLPGRPLSETGMLLEFSSEEQQGLFFNVGAGMGKLHALSDRWLPPDEFKRPSWNAEGLLGEKPLWGQFWDCDGLSTSEKQTLTRLRERLASALDHLAARGADYGLIHGDLVPENLLVDGDRVSIIDFDDAGFGWRMFDVATVLLKNRREPNYRQIADALLAGYRSQRSLGQADLETLPLFLTIRSLTEIGWTAARLEMPGARERLARHVAEAMQLASEPGGD